MGPAPASTYFADQRTACPPGWTVGSCLVAPAAPVLPASKPLRNNGYGGERRCRNGQRCGPVPAAGLEFHQGPLDNAETGGEPPARPDTEQNWCGIGEHVKGPHCNHHP